jgi:hypothetical protein
MSKAKVIHLCANYSSLKKMASRNLTENLLLPACDAHVDAPNSSQETDDIHSILSSMTTCAKNYFQ